MTTTIKALSPEHLTELKDKSAISASVIEARGYQTIYTSDQARALGFSHKQSMTVDQEHPALIIPYRNPNGDIVTYAMKPKNPRCLDDKGKGKLKDGTYPQRFLKYELPKGAGNVLDCHPAIIDVLADPARPLCFTEGAKKADSLVSRGYAAINVNGVYGWRGSNDQQGKAALADFEYIALNGRRCLLLFDSDVRSNDNVKSALRRFRSYLYSKGAAVVIPVLLPDSDQGKAGIDDYFAAGHSIADFEALVTYWETFQPDLGGDGSRRNWTTEQHHDLFREWGYHFAINDMNERIEVNGEPLDDTKADIIEARLRDERVPVDHAKKSVTVAANLNRYHPIKAYLESLTWDGSDHIGTLTDYFIDQENIFSTWMKRWLIGAVAKVYDSDNTNFMLVLDGPQGIGKSYLAKWLCPLSKYFLESPVNPDDKDSRIALMSYFIWEVSELGAVTRRADVEALKQFLTRRKISERLPYGRLPIDKPATASFFGTVNNTGAGFLTDTTGNRRFAVATITRIDWNYTSLDVNQIWAQAVALYRSGEPFVLTADEQRRRDEINLRYQTSDPYEDLIEDRFLIDLGRADEEAWQMTAAEILAIMGEKPGRGESMRLSPILKSKHLEKRRIARPGKGTPQVWCGITSKI